MNAVVLQKPKTRLTFETRNKPQPGSNEILLKVKASGICHTDLHIAQGDWALPRLPLILGHEIAGVVDKVGSRVGNFKRGDRAGVSWIYSTCGACEFCQSNRERFCPAFVSTGMMVDGGFAEYVRVPASHAVEIPAELKFTEAAPLFCAGLTAYRAVKISGVGLGETVAIWGVGGLGQCAIQIAKALGARVIAVDLSANKLDLARKLGADRVINGSSKSPGRIIASEGGAHAVLNFAPVADATRHCFDALRTCGTLVLVSLPPGNLRLPIVGAIRKGIRILTCAIGTRQDLREVLALAASGKIRSIVETCKLEEINQVFDRMREGSILGRTVVELP